MVASAGTSRSIPPNIIPEYPKLPNKEEEPVLGFVISEKQRCLGSRNSWECHNLRHSPPKSNPQILLRSLSWKASPIARLGPSHRRKQNDPLRRASNSCLESTSRPFVPRSQSSKCCGCSTSKPPGVAAIIFAVIVRSRAARRTPSWQTRSPAATAVSPAAPGAPNSASGLPPPICHYTPPRSTSAEKPALPRHGSISSSLPAARQLSKAPPSFTPQPGSGRTSRRRNGALLGRR